MTRRRKLAASIAIVIWLAVVGVAWLIFLGGQIANCLGLPGSAANEACVSAFALAHPRQPLLDSPLTWLVVLVGGLLAIWRVARA